MRGHPGARSQALHCAAGGGSSARWRVARACARKTLVFVARVGRDGAPSSGTTRLAAPARACPAAHRGRRILRRHGRRRSTRTSRRDSVRAPRRCGRGPGFRLVLPIPLRALDGNTVLVLGTFLIISVLVGEAATRASRRAISTERARGALATEQGALRRVATLVARQSTPGELFRAVGTPGGARVGRGAGRAAPGGDAGGGRGVAEEVFAAVAEEIGRRGPPSLAPALASWEAPFREVRGLWADVDSTRAGSDIRLLPGREPLRARSTRRNQAHADPDPHAPSVPGQLQTRGCLLRDSSWDRTTATRTGGSGRSRSTR